MEGLTKACNVHRECFLRAAGKVRVISCGVNSTALIFFNFV